MLNDLMGKKQISEKEWELLIKGFVQTLVTTLTSERGEGTSLALNLGITRSALSDMKNGRITGSAVVVFRMLFMLAGLSDEQTQATLKNPHSLINGLKSGPVSGLDELYLDLKSKYEANELSAWFTLLASKAEVEKSLNLSIKASSAKPKKPRKV